MAQYLGDGLMVYFGWPSAHEDDAERSVRAALEIVQAVKAVRADPPLAVHIGVATGPVVVGAVSRADDAEAKLAVGETPNLAARLQGLAGPDEVVIAPSTRRLVGAAFELSDHGFACAQGNRTAGASVASARCAQTPRTLRGGPRWGCTDAAGRA